MEWMKTSLTEIVDKKQQEKYQLNQLKNNYITTIYKGLVDRTSIKEIHKKLLDETISQKKNGMATSDNMLKAAIRSVNFLKKKESNQQFVNGYVKTTYGKIVEESSPIEILGIYMFDLIHKFEIEKGLSHEIVRQADKNEADMKDKVIKDNINKNRNLENPKIFYLASTHKDSAEDHKDYQGRIYIDEKWKNVIKDDDLKEKIKKYIDIHNVKTIQWVVGSPVWFITRPNCRHYFKILSTEEVLSNSKTNLLQQYKMETAIGRRQYLQTIKHSTSKKWYDEVRNAELVRDKYKERLKLHQDMYKVNPNPIIRNAIIKDNALIYKWNKYIVDKKRGVV